MKNCALKNFAKPSFRFFLIVLLCMFSFWCNAQTFYNVAALPPNPNITEMLVEQPSKDVDREIKSQGSYLIKDGRLDEIYNLKFVLPNIELKASSTNNIIGGKKISFEQTHVMVLPIMGMVHVVGNLSIGDVTTKGSFQLEFMVNDDQSITFKGEKAIRLIEFYPNDVKMVDEANIDINFVLKNNKNNSTVLNAE